LRSGTDAARTTEHIHVDEREAEERHQQRAVPNLRRNLFVNG